jgi:TonB family protein
MPIRGFVSSLGFTLQVMKSCVIALAVSPGGTTAANATNDPAAHPPRVECPNPEWPPLVRQAHLAGTTGVRVDVGSDGSVSSAVVARRSGDTPVHALADEAVKRSIEQCRFPEAKGTSSRKGVIPVNWAS